MIRSNASRVIKVLIGNIEGITADQVSRACAIAVIPEMRVRIHVDGKDSNGGQIGSYSNAYMKVRTGNYGDGAKFKRGAKAGQFKDQKKKGDAGDFSKGNSTGVNRPVYNRTADTKVVLSLTRQMENDWGVVAAGKSYGGGFKNPLNYNKSIWCEETYKKPIYKLSVAEIELARKTALGFIDQLKGNA